MVHGTYTHDVKVNVSAQRLWLALIKDAQNFLPKSLPDRVAGVEYEGTGFQAGSIRTVKFHKGLHGFDHVKEKLEEVDLATRYVKFSVVEGGLASVLSDVKISLHFKDGDQPGTAIVTSKVEYEAAGEVKEIPEEHKNGGAAIIKSAEAYLLQNNDYA